MASFKTPGPHVYRLCREIELLDTTLKQLHTYGTQLCVGRSR